MQLSNRCDHSIGGGHCPTVPCGFAHECAIGESCLFRKGKNAIGETPAPIAEALLQPIGALIGANLANALSDLTNNDGRQSYFCVVQKEPRHDGFRGSFLQCF